MLILFVVVGANLVAWLGVAAAGPVRLEPVLGGLSASNPFDPERKPWPDVVPPVAPVPAPEPVTDADLQVYGVVAVGSVRKAYLKLGPRFSGVQVGSNGFAAVNQGASIGEFVLADVQADQVLLQAPGGQQWVRFSSKKDRSAAPIPSVPKPLVASAAPVPAGARQGVAVGAALPIAVSGAPASAGVVGGFAAERPVPPSAPSNSSSAFNGSVGSLAAAIAAAQASAQAQAQSPTSVVPSGSAAAMSNPFLQLMQNAPKR